MSTFFLDSSNLLAYIGPGAGLGMLSALIGLVSAVGVALFTIALWPIRKMLKRKRNAAA